MDVGSLRAPKFSVTAFPGAVTPASPGPPAAQLLGLRPLMRELDEAGPPAGREVGREG